jgi:ribosome-associated toxin RatA of RatAB toxin-antitoxin module
MTRTHLVRRLPVRRFALALLLIAARTLAGVPGHAAEGSAEVDAPAAVIWSVLTDFESWAGFMPGLAQVQVEESSADRIAIHHLTETMGLTISFTTLARVDAERMRLELALDPNAVNDLRVMEASWQLTELSNGRVRVEFRSELESGRPVPRLLERRVIASTVSETVAALAAEVERRRAVSIATATSAR